MKVKKKKKIYVNNNTVEDEILMRQNSSEGKNVVACMHERSSLVCKEFLQARGEENVNKNLKVQKER